MSTQKEKIQDPKKARRRFESIFAEALISKELNWNIEFISGGYDSYTREELLSLVKGIYDITGQKQWLNIGTLNRKELEMFKPYIEGYAATIETVNWDLRKKVCPSKTLPPIMESLKLCEELNLKKSMTIIIGLGETISDFENLKEFILENDIDRITFYTLNPQEGTPFEKSPSKDYYCDWIRKTRDAYPELDIIAGAWLDKPDYYEAILKSGANSFTKLPTIRKFGSKKMGKVVNSVKRAGDLGSELMKLPNVNWDAKIENLNFDQEFKERIKDKLNVYLKQMSTSQAED